MIFPLPLLLAGFVRGGRVLYTRIKIIGRHIILPQNRQQIMSTECPTLFSVSMPCPLAVKAFRWNVSIT
jgi:hypothetical protein